MAPYFPPPGGTPGAGVTDDTVLPISEGPGNSDGRDGPADLDGINTVTWATLVGSTYTCARVGLPTDFHVRPGITFLSAGLAGPWATGDWVIEGDFSADGHDAIGVAGGTVTAAGTLPATIAGTAGGAAGGNNNGTNANVATVEGPTSGRYSGAPGGDGQASTGGTAAAVNTTGPTRGNTHAMAGGLGGGTFISNIGVNTVSCGNGGAGGGGNAAGAGGGGGAGGHMIHGSGRSCKVTATGRIHSNGGAGAAGGPSAGGGGGGPGGRVMLKFGTFDLADPLLSVQARGGAGGAGGAGTTGASYGPCGLPGEIIYLSGKPAPMATRHHRVNLTAPELAAAIVNGVLDISGTYTIGADAGRTTLGTGGSSLSFFELLTPDGLISGRFDMSDFKAKLRVRGVDVLATADLNTIVTPAPCFHPYITGDVLAWRARYDPNGGARSMLLRLWNNRTGGFDEVGVASGALLAAATSGNALSSSTAAGSWGPAPSYILATHTANVVGTVVILGDSVCSGRMNSVGWDGVSVGSRMGWVTQLCKSYARQGDTWAGQLAAWLAAPERGNVNTKAVILQVGLNDIGAGHSAATITADAQTVVNDIAASTPGAKIIISVLTPEYSNLATAALRAIYDAVQANYDGSGGTPVTGVHARATAHVATMGDLNKSLRERADLGDYIHPGYFGRSLNARSIGTAYDSTGLAR